MRLSVGSVARIYCIQTIIFFKGFSFRILYAIRGQQVLFQSTSAFWFRTWPWVYGPGQVRRPLLGSPLFKNSRVPVFRNSGDIFQELKLFHPEVLWNSSLQDCTPKSTVNIVASMKVKVREYEGLVGQILRSPKKNFWGKYVFSHFVVYFGWHFNFFFFFGVKMGFRIFG